jgi:4a-hydroxytetrahydrobiopterin dehydratase
MPATYEDLLAEPVVASGPGMRPLEPPAIAERLAALGHGWTIERGRLTRSYEHPDFAAALAHVNRLGELSEAVGHHPDLELGWGRVCVSIWTHAADGLTASDFTWAARAERLADA